MSTLPPTYNKETVEHEVEEDSYNEVYFNSSFPRTIREWNNLPGDITAATSLEEFRASLTSRLP